MIICGKQRCRNIADNHRPSGLGLGEVPPTCVYHYYAGYATRRQLGKVCEGLIWVSIISGIYYVANLRSDLFKNKIE